MQFFTRLKRSFLTTAPVRFLIAKSKKVSLPGMQGIPTYDVVTFFFSTSIKDSMRERSNSIAFHIAMAIPPFILFLFTLLPLLPISDDFIDHLYSLIRDLIPSEENNNGIIIFLNNLLTTKRNGLLSTGFLLTMFISSNAMIGIMSSFDKEVPGFKKRKGFNRRMVALKLTFFISLLLLIALAALITHGKMLKLLGVSNTTLIWIIHNLRWVVIICLFYISISVIYRYAPAVDKKWKIINPGAVLATFLMLLFTAGFSFWISRFSSFNELYGSIGTIIMLLFLIRFSSLVLLIGFEFNVSIRSLRQKADQQNV